MPGFETLDRRPTLGLAPHHAAGGWQQTYEGCKQLASAMKGDSTGLMKAPDCERIPQFCSNDPNTSDCKAELDKFSTK